MTTSQVDMTQNEVLRRLPQHLLQYVHQQHYDRYSPIDQAVWRYVMRRNTAYLPKVAHHSYLSGLAQAGISTEQIPSMYGMNRILKDIGWAAVAVDGFIPSAAFMEFQAYNVLVIAQEIRQLEHLQYTPAPDIIHESAGHAPIIANPEYSEYLRRFGEIGCRAIASAKDHEMYEAIRRLSILKEAPDSTPDQVAEAEQVVVNLQNDVGEPSEMNLIKNLHWWTVEYGLIGNLENPKIYGAGLLSSIGESKSCLQPSVQKRWYDLSAAHQNFDITQPQPHLYVTPDFAHLSFVLEQFANQMALRTGGTVGIQKLIDSEQLGTVEYNTGLQVSGVFTNVFTDQYQQPIYVQTTGATALAYQQKELIGHGTLAHVAGFGSPVGKLKNINIPIEKMSPYDLSAYKIKEGEYTTLEFEGGVKIEGEVITGKRTLQGTIILISFKNCTVTLRGQVLFEPSWGLYDMAVGQKIAAAYAGPADHHSFDLITHTIAPTEASAPKSEVRLRLEGLYEEVRQMRESGKVNQQRISEILAILAQQYPADWLLKTEIEELKN
ncbi:MAG: aromatic amino acid hydroxylase [Cytophagia bacterium]|nr:MAG: aromatic amino acid hydroxylase [Runella sp.]TAG21993.1 MAG: aromatic amino acid hydroxylase [Cytophagales bacterium]TAG38655.1 MAG: aromatic amino acid hydroxylase [Cytophagia bacterium]TAG75056.1 MAG: aromatic amino acid hydroxylase [Runella slithyformis]TAG82733.1 MAG: aromatic amino acid hydroxylase [Cytophagales bacterium]